jgi:hypothetical protein
MRLTFIISLTLIIQGNGKGSSHPRVDGLLLNAESLNDFCLFYVPVPYRPRPLCRSVEQEYLLPRHASPNASLARDVMQKERKKNRKTKWGGICKAILKEKEKEKEKVKTREQ